MKLISSNLSFSGEQRVYEHDSAELGCNMRFAIYIPEHALQNQVCPTLFWLSGLTCTEQNFITKSGYQRFAAEHGFIVVAPDTSPRGDHVPDDTERYDFAQGAGFYLDATEKPWRDNFRMESYIAQELYDLISQNFAVDSQRIGIFGHSMGGHGAISLHLRYPKKFKSVSAFSPIVAPTRGPWGINAFTRYLGEDETTWSQYDSCVLVEKRPSEATILIDQGSADDFLKEQLKPELFEKACADAGQALTLRMQLGYDHSYFFISTFIGDHFQHHANAL